jgi:hypothetical protein
MAMASLVFKQRRMKDMLKGILLGNRQTIPDPHHYICKSIYLSGIQIIYNSDHPTQVCFFSAEMSRDLGQKGKMSSSWNIPNSWILGKSD